MFDEISIEDEAYIVKAIGPDNKAVTFTAPCIKTAQAVAADLKRTAYRLPHIYANPAIGTPSKAVQL